MLNIKSCNPLSLLSGLTGNYRASEDSGLLLIQFFVVYNVSRKIKI